MIVSCIVLKKGGKIIVVLGDYDKEDFSKEAQCSAQLITCVEKFKQWSSQGTRIDVICPHKPAILTDNPQIAPKELTKLVYRIPLWLQGSSESMNVHCVDVRNYEGNEILSDIRSLIRRPQVLEQWISGECKIRNLSRTTWNQYLKSVNAFLETTTKGKKDPKMVRNLEIEVKHRVTEEYVKNHKIFGDKKFNFGRQILHTFKKIRPENRHLFLHYFRTIDQLMGDICVIRSVGGTMATQSKSLFVGPQSHAQTLKQYIQMELGFELADVGCEHRADNKSVDLQSLGACLDAFKSKKKRKKKKKKKTVEATDGEEKEGKKDNTGEFDRKEQKDEKMGEGSEDNTEGKKE